MPDVQVTVTQDRLAEMLKAVRDLTKQEVLVGVPESKAAREAVADDPEDADINNAALAYIHNYGSPARNIPARPFMEPGIKDARTKIVAQMKTAALAAIAGKPTEMNRALNRAGLQAQSAIQKKITDGPFLALAPQTLAARRRKGRTGEKPLLDTGQMRRSITYVIRPKKGRR